MTDPEPVSRLTVRPEPRGLTFADMMAIVAGVALALVVPPSMGMPPFGPGLSFFVQLWCEWLIVALMLATTLALLVRQARHRRPPKPGEWLAILYVADLQGSLPNLDGLVNDLFPYHEVTTAFGRCRWIIAGVSLAVALAGVGVLAAGRRVWPAWAKTVLVGAVAMVLIWGPIDVVMRQGPAELPPFEEFSPRWLFYLVVAARRLAALAPLGLVFGIPAVAAIRGLRRREAGRRAWTDWPGLVVALAIGLFAVVDIYALQSAFPPDSLRATRIVFPAWVVGVGLLSAFLVRRLGPAWGRLMAIGSSPQTPEVSP